MPRYGDGGGRIIAVTWSDVGTPHGRARVHLDASGDGRAALVLGHGAGGRVDAPDLVAVATTARSLRIAVALVEQPYRVAGRRSPAPAGQLDTAWIAVVDHLRTQRLARIPIIVGGRSSGARVACRTAAATRATAVLCVAFPLQPPRRAGSQVAASRLPELEQVPVPTLVVQGARDPFGIPPAGPDRTVTQVEGNHGSRMDLEAVEAAVRRWLTGLLEAPAR